MRAELAELKCRLEGAEANLCSLETAKKETEDLLANALTASDALQHQLEEKEVQLTEHQAIIQSFEKTANIQKVSHNLPPQHHPTPCNLASNHYPRSCK